MRTIPILVSLCAMTAVATAGGEQASPPEDGRTLTGAEIDRYLAPYRAEIRHCYLGSATGGSLDLQMIIHRDGSVYQLKVITPGIAPRAARRIDRCIQKLAREWHFPVRRGFTHATVPFRFVRTIAPGAGPQPSCWSKRGCPSRSRRT
jgi:hypothetical protein